MLKKGRFDRAGVSEVVGTILVLLITVVIFSSIILWVYTIPTPTATDRVSFAAEFQPGAVEGGYVNLTHLGGDSLFESSTRVYLTVNDRTEVFRNRGDYLWGPYGIDGPDTTWNIGEVWTYYNQSSSFPSANVSVMVVDLERGVVLWDDELHGGGEDDAPVFLDKWVDGDLATTVTRDPAEVGKGWTVFAWVIDPNGVISSVSAYPTFGTDDCAPSWYPLTDVGEDTFRISFTCQAQKSWDGGIIILRAVDGDGRETRSRVALRVVDSAGGGGGQGPSTFGFGTDVQRYDIFEEADWDLNGWDATSARVFEKGQGVVVVVASHYLKNLVERNQLILYNQARFPLAPEVYGGGPVGPNTVPSSTDAFSFIGFLNDFYIYEFRFNTDSGLPDGKLEFGSYNVEIGLQAANVAPPQNRFAVTDGLTVTDEGGEVPDFPNLQFFSDPELTVETDTYNSTDVMYAKITVDTADGTVTVGDVTISDNLGGVQVWATPGNPPIGAIEANTAEGYYTFSVDLSNPNLDQWLFGESSYTFRIKRITDLDEQYALSKQLTVRGPRWSLDVMTALREYQFSRFFGGNNEYWYSTFYRNDGAWSRTLVESYSCDSAWTWWCRFIGDRPPWGGGDFNDVELQDLDEDGDLDALFGLQNGLIFLYRNTLGDGTRWVRYDVDNLANPITAVAAGEIDLDTDNDIVVGTGSGQVWWYSNDGSYDWQWTPNLVANIGSPVNTIRIADMGSLGSGIPDGHNDVVVGSDDRLVRIFWNAGNGVFGTQVVTHHFLQHDDGGEGERVAGTYLDTWSADGVYEELREVVGDAEERTLWEVTGELPAGFADPPDGTIQQLKDRDGFFLTLKEGRCDPLGGGAPYFYIADSVSGWNCNSQPPGHQFSFGSVDVGGGDTALLTIVGRISQGWEPMQVICEVGCGSVELIDTIWEETWTTKSLDLTAAGYSGGDLVITIQDWNTGSGQPKTDTDAQPTWVSLDYMAVEVVHLEGETSRLAYVWDGGTIQDGGQAYKFVLKAHHSTDVEPEDFLFQWSTSMNGPWSDLLLVTKTVDDGTSDTIGLPAGIGGQDIFIRAVDTNRTNASTEVSTLFVDLVDVARYHVTPTPWVSPSMGAAIEDLVVADLTADGILDVVLASGNNVMIISGLSRSVIKTMTLPGAVQAVDVGHLDGDDIFDVVAGYNPSSGGGRVDWFSGASGWASGARQSIATFADDVLTLRVGDVDGDYWDDVVVGTFDGYIRLFPNNRGIGWRTPRDVDKLDTPVLDLDIGDVDRGVVIDPAQVGS